MSEPGPAPDEENTAEPPVEPPSWLARQLSPLVTDRLTLFSGLTAAVVLTVSRYHLSTGEYVRRVPEEIKKAGGLFAWPFRTAGATTVADWVAQATSPTAEHLYWFVGSLLLFLAVPLGLARLLGISARTLGAGLGDVRYGLKATGLLFFVMLPFVVGAGFSEAFARHYPMAGGAATRGLTLVVYELAYAGYFVGWEFVHRGLVCVALYPRLGAAAILLHTVPFAVMHAGKPELEAYGSIIAGLALGVVAVRARSFWYGALLHAAIAVTMDLVALARTSRFPAAW